MPYFRLKRSFGTTKMPGTSSWSCIESLIVSGGSPNCTAPYLVFTCTPPRGRKVTLAADVEVTEPWALVSPPPLVDARCVYRVRRLPRLTISARALMSAVLETIGSVRSALALPAPGR